MAVSFDTLKVGEELMDVRREVMGNTTMRHWCRWYVSVKEIDAAGRRALVSWNGNRAEWWPERSLRKLYRKEPKAYRDQRAREEARRAR